MNVLILFSGGIDSTACLNYFLHRNDTVHLLYFNYGQGDEEIERNAAESVAKYYKTKLDIITISGCIIPKGMIPGRNAFLLSLALLKIPFMDGGIAIGVHSYTDYTDCSENFISLMQNIFDVYYDGRIQILTPFLEWNKYDIIEYARKEKIPLELVYSTSMDKNLYIRGKDE
ncbi:7-cyano-7-deazaguanine synthase [Spirochaetia bacterium]|nr:7-cyano-7-deazaguanine synthase [Spirochaetia bacterium]